MEELRRRRQEEEQILREVEEARWSKDQELHQLSTYLHAGTDR